MSHHSTSVSAALLRLSAVAALSTLAACNSQNVVTDSAGPGSTTPSTSTANEASGPGPSPSAPVEASTPAAPLEASGRPSVPTTGQLGQPTAAQLADAAASNAFTLAMYPLVATEDNLVVSPFNARLALSMLAIGSAGTTRTQFLQTLHFAADADMALQGGSTLQRYRELAGTGTRSADGVIQGLSLYNATSVWPASQIRLLAPWTESMRTSYGSEVSALDYAADPEAARAQINSWTSDQTRTLIPNLIPPGGVDTNTRLVVVSATYFLGAWQRAFDPTRTRPLPFTNPAGQTADRPTMTQRGTFAFAQMPELQIVRMPYVGEQLSMVLAMPAQGTAPDWVASQTAESFAALLSGLSRAEIDLELPRFRTESALSLNRAVQQLGVTEAFDQAADFSAVTTDASLYIDTIIHKAVIEVTESGTEAAAATAVVTRSAGAVRTPRMQFNRPFAFFILDDATGLILFAGHVNDPVSPN